VATITRREALQRAGLMTATSALGSSIFVHPLANISDTESDPHDLIHKWIRSARIVIAEGYNPPFYPSFDYEPEKALAIARQLNADSIRFPTASYFAYFPTKTKYPIHPELGGRDPLRRTVELFHEAD
jgi:hypothetical protein